MRAKKINFEWKKTPMCEVCKKEVAWTFSFFGQDNQTELYSPMKSTYTGKELEKAIKHLDDPVRVAEHEKEWKELKRQFVLHRHSAICKFTGDCTKDSEMYWVKIEDFFNIPSSIVDWMAHLHEKNWFNEDDFFDMMDRFREASGSYNSL